MVSPNVTLSWSITKSQKIFFKQHKRYPQDLVYQMEEAVHFLID
jgi:hypothetical protein